MSASTPAEWLNRIAGKIGNKLGFQPEALRRYSFNTAWMLVERVVVLGVSMLTGLFVARYLGAEQYGLMGYAASFAALFAAVPSLGVRFIMIRDLATDPTLRDRYLGTTFAMHLAGACLTFLLIGIGAWTTEPDQTARLYIMAISTGYFFHGFNVVEYYFQARVQARPAAVVHMVNVLISSACKVFFMVEGYPLSWFIGLLAVEQAILATGLALAYQKMGLRLKEWRFSGKLVADLLRQSWFFILSGVAVNVYMKIDQVMIKSFIGAEENGYYAVAARLSEAWYFIPVAIANSLIPAIAFAKEKGETLYYDRFQKLYNLLAWIAILIAFFMMLVSGWLITTLLTPSFSPAAEVLNIHIWAGVFVFMGVGSDKWLTQEKRYVLSVYRTVAGAAMNIGLNAWFIPAFGIQGAAWATLLSYAFSSWLAYAFLPSTRHTFLMQTRALIFPLLWLWKRQTKRNPEDE